MLLSRVHSVCLATGLSSPDQPFLLNYLHRYKAPQHIPRSTFFTIELDAKEWRSRSFMAAILRTRLDGGDLYH